MKNKIKFIFFFLFIFFFSIKSFSQDIKISDVLINGNRNISKDTILSYLGITSKNFTTDTIKLNLLNKKLFDTNFFSSIELKISNNTLVVNVTENPLIEFIIISGLENREDFKKDIDNFLSLKPNLLFSEVLLNADIVLIQDYLKSKGFFNNKVEYKVNIIENNRVNVFFDIELNKQFVIKDISFIGNKKFSSSKLLSIISSRENSFFSFFSSSTIPSLDRINFDTISLKNFYLSEGYYDVQVSNSSINIINENEVEIVFSIDAGNKYTISEYIIANDISFLNPNDVIYINNLINKYINKNYNQYSLNKLRNNIFDYISQQGFSSSVSYSIQKKTNNELIYVININEILKKKIIRNIKVIGNDITEEKVIRNNILFAEGDIFNDFLIKKSLDQLQSLYFFKDVKIDYNDVQKLNLVDIIVSLKESPTGEISSGIGVGSSESAISFNLKENNFLGKGIRTDIGLSLGTEEIRANFFFSDPDFLDSGNTFKNNFFVTKNNYESVGYENKVIGDNISYAYEIFQDIEFESGIGINFDDISVNGNASSLIKSQEGNYFTSKVFYNIFTDKRDRKFKPSSGYSLGFGQDLAFAPSDIPYISNSLYGSFYKELMDNYTGSIRYKIKSINSLNNDALKLSDMLFLTDREMRGFTNRRVGPKLENDYTGGNYVFVSSLSSTFPNGLPDTWKASTNMFFDIGNVWGTDISGVNDSNQLRTSIGLGLTWQSPIGPISITYAEPLSKAQTDEVQNFNFRLGTVF